MSEVSQEQVAEVESSTQEDGLPKTVNDWTILGYAYTRNGTVFHWCQCKCGYPQAKPKTVIKSIHRMPQSCLKCMADRLREARATYHSPMFIRTSEKYE